MTNEERFIGKGITFPIQLTNGKVELETGWPLIRSSIKMILGWEYGSRYYLAEFGSKLEQLLEEPNDMVLKGIINYYVIQAINRWEKRIQMVSVSIVGTFTTHIDLKITLRMIGTKSEDSYIYPFYRQINT